MNYIKTFLLLWSLTSSFFAISQCQDATACNFGQNTADNICLSIDTVQVHTSGDLSGQTTYRLYVNFPIDQDYYLMSVAGVTSQELLTNILPTNISTTTSFYQDPLGASVATDINPATFQFSPTIEYDSWITIIAEDNTSTLSSINVQGSWINDFRNGQNIVVDGASGGIWYVNDQNHITNPNAIGISGGSALIGQFTTDGIISANVSIQFAVEGVLDQVVSYANLSTDFPCTYGTCVYPLTNFDCDGNCVNDTDGDGVCDEFEVAGCTDLSACNYDAKVTDPDPALCDFSCVGAIVQSGPCNSEVTTTYNGVTYDLVEIDGRCWFAEDLRTSTYNNGGTIQAVTEPEVWSSLTSSDGGRLTYLADGGIGQDYVSYNWYAVNSGLLCPSGWHVASNSDWNSLEAQAFGARAHRLGKQTQIVVGSAQDLYDLGWFEQYTDGDIFNQISFSGGLRENVDGKWRDADGSIYWWTAEEYTPKANETGRRANSAWARGLKSQGGWGRYNDLWSTSNSKDNALRVRCVKDAIPDEDLLFFIAAGPNTLGETDPDANVNAQDTVYVDQQGRTASAGYIFDNTRGDRFITDKGGVLVPIGNYRVKPDQRVLTISNGDNIDREYGGPTLQNCRCCCTAGSHQYLQTFTVTTRNCITFCNNQENCEALFVAPIGGPQEQCWDDIRGIADDYSSGYLNRGWKVRQQEDFSTLVEMVGSRWSSDFAVGVQAIPFFKEEYLREGVTTTIDDLAFMKGWVFVKDNKWYRINDSWIVEGGGDNPLPEWGGISGPEYLNVCACWSPAPWCEPFDSWSTLKRKNCEQICGQLNYSVHPGSPPCNNPE